MVFAVIAMLLNLKDKNQHETFVFQIGTKEWNCTWCGVRCRQLDWRDKCSVPGVCMGLIFEFFAST
jgi:hypothetical protein